MLQQPPGGWGSGRPDAGGSRLRGILCDWEDALPSALGRNDRLVVETTRNVGAAVRLRR